MRWDSYEKRFREEAALKGKSQNQIDSWINYAHNLFKQKLPIIYNQTHFALLLGIDNEYLHAMSNAPEFFYKTFFIPKRNGHRRRIDEPLPDLKRVQKWILNEILYNIPASKYAKAYVPGMSIKENARFHRNQSLLVAVDIKDFFPSIKSGYILNVFLSVGYNIETSVLLTRLCCLKETLPQGAPTSAYLSNLVLRKLDENISSYCLDKKIRYTRYADDMTFSGDFDIAALLFRVDQELKYLGLSRNKRKLKVMKEHDRQCTTGIIVNKNMQVSREYRMEIRKEIHYIERFGLDDHLSHVGETRMHYVDHLIGKIEYALFINPKDHKMQEYLEKIRPYKDRSDDS